jgi:hypothetical protein
MMSRKYMRQDKVNTTKDPGLYAYLALLAWKIMKYNIRLQTFCRRFVKMVFLGFSYEFRTQISCCLASLALAIKKINLILDADIQGLFPHYI